MSLNVPQIRKLCKDPFGPYSEGRLLSPQFKKCGLKTLKMEAGGSPIGLDETEFVELAPDSSRPVKYDVIFYGILELDQSQLDRLSTKGLKDLEREFRGRSTAIYPQVDTRGLDLRKISQYSKISVWVRCVKGTAASFMTATGYETDLVINSKGKRTYIIKSLDTATFDSSRNFFTRYRLWLLIESLKDNDPAQTPQEGRTIHWLVEEYSRRLREKSIGRFPRHVSRAEIIGIFAAHADWILAQHLASVSRNIKLLNIQKWIVFCEEVASARLKANRQSLDWGLPEGGSPNEDLWNLSRFGVNKGNKDWKAKIQSAMNPIPKRAPLVKTPRAMSPVVANLPTEFIYDSDFSEASTSSYSDSSDDEDLVIGLPRTIEFSLRRPTISDGQFKWQCPACDYVIDLLDLKAENTKVLSPADDKWIRDRAWKNPSDEHVQAVFFAMVKDHFTLHDNSQKSQQRPKSPKPGENHYQVKAEAVDMEIY